MRVDIGAARNSVGSSAYPVHSISPWQESVTGVGQNLARRLAGWILGAGEAGPEARCGPPPSRRLLELSPKFVELGEVGGEGRILEPPAVEPSVGAAERPGVGPAGVTGECGANQQLLLSSSNSRRASSSVMAAGHAYAAATAASSAACASASPCGGAL